MLRYLELLLAIVSWQQLLLLLAAGVWLATARRQRRRRRRLGGGMRLAAWLPLTMAMLLSVLSIYAAQELEMLLARGGAINDAQRELLLDDALERAAKLVVLGGLLSCLLATLVRRWKQPGEPRV
jgi:hypothetical protein